MRASLNMASAFCRWILMSPRPKRRRPRSRRQRSVSAKIASALVELANRDDTSAELLLGADAVEYVKQAAATVAGSGRTWHDFSVSVKAAG